MKEEILESVKLDSYSYQTISDKELRLSCLILASERSDFDNDTEVVIAEAKKFSDFVLGVSEIGLKEKIKEVILEVLDSEKVLKL